MTQRSQISWLAVHAKQWQCFVICYRVKEIVNIHIVDCSQTVQWNGIGTLTGRNQQRAIHRYIRRDTDVKLGSFTNDGLNFYIATNLL